MMALSEEMRVPYSPLDDINMEEYEKSQDGKDYKIFLHICERLSQKANRDEIACGTYAEVFSEIESRNIDISDIIKPSKYNAFKKRMLKRRGQWCPIVGNAEVKVYNLRNVDDLKEYEQLVKNEMQEIRKRV